MFKQSLISLALAASALLSTPASAAIVSLGYAGTLSNGYAVSGTMIWDSAATGIDYGTKWDYSPSSFSLSINATDYTSQVSQAFVILSETQSNQDSITIGLDFASNATGALAGFANIRLLLRDSNGDLINGTSSLPADLDFLGKVSESILYLTSTNPTAPRTNVVGALSLTDATPAPTTPTTSVPEPGSLLLASLAGLALTATRRRKPLAS